MLLFLLLLSVCTVHLVIFMANIAIFCASFGNLLVFRFCTHTHIRAYERNLGVRARIQLSIFCAGLSCCREDTHIYVIYKQSYNFFSVAVEESKRFSTDLFIDIPTKLRAYIECCTKEKVFGIFFPALRLVFRKNIWWTTMNRINILLEISRSLNHSQDPWPINMAYWIGLWTSTSHIHNQL